MYTENENRTPLENGASTMWGWETAQATLEQAGFARVERRLLAHDPMNVWFVSSKEGTHAS